jgi:maleate isomerase
MATGFGTRARVGQLYPSGGLCDYELQLMAPEGVQVVTTRMPFRATGVADDLALVEGLEDHASLLADAEVDLIAFNCTAASLLVGPQEVRRRVETATGIPVVTTIEAVVAALDVLGARRIVLVNPYPAEVERHEVEHLSGLGIEVLATAGPECATPVEQGSISPGTWVQVFEGLETDDADAVLLSCAGTRTAEVLEDLEEACGRPVVTSNQALLRLVLVSLGLEPVSPGHGTLLAADRLGRAS